MKLVIIEGPGKRDTIKKYLGSDYEVFATAGHVRDLPSKYLAINIKDNFEPIYEIMPDKKKIVAELKSKASKAESIYLATDPDREGEAISWHLAYILGKKADDKCRVEFNEISKEKILNALKSPRTINQNLVNAQQARRVLDRLVGYNISPVLWKKIQKNLSAGRVQSVVLKLVCDRETEISKFVPKEYWSVVGEFQKQNLQPIFKSSLIAFNNKKFEVNSSEQMEQIKAQLTNQNFVISSIKKTTSISKAPDPFITSTMQQEAINKLSMSLKQVSMAAQSLYEGVVLGNEGKVALVTYIRTDSKRVSDDAKFKARDFISKNYGNKFLAQGNKTVKKTANVQDAHEAIRPIDINRTPESVKPYLSNEHFKLYKLIYSRFLASQMADAIYDLMTVELTSCGYKFKSVDKNLNFAGFTAVYSNADAEQDNESVKFPDLAEGDEIKLLKLNCEQKFTKPLPRYTESTLVKAMEDKGIGRPATYTQTILVLLNRNYVEKQAKNLVPTQLGITVNELLQKYFSTIFDVDFTAKMEKNLDKIEISNADWHDEIHVFYDDLTKLLQNANITKDDIKFQVLTDQICEKCGKPLLEKEGRYGKFLACSGYPECKNIVKIKPVLKIVGICPKCGGNLVQRKTKTGKTFYSCNNYPKCEFSTWNLPLDKKCPLCESNLELVNFRKQKYEKCTNDKCNYRFDIVEQKKE